MPNGATPASPSAPGARRRPIREVRTFAGLAHGRDNNFNLVRMLAASAVVSLVLGTAVFEVRMLAITYGALYLTQLPGFWLHRYNALGNYSYGVYIYGWLIEQAVLLPDGTIRPVLLIAVALPSAILSGMASWSLVEKPALARKQAVYPAGARLPLRFGRVGSASHP